MTTSRRYTLGAAFLATVAAAAVGTFTIVRSAMAAPTAATTAAGPGDRWLQRLDGTHKQLFDFAAPGGGIPLVHMMNYYDTYNAAYGVKDADIDAVGTFYGSATFYGLSDAAWAKYRLGEFLEANDAAGKPATANPWRTAPVVLGMTLAPASIESLQRRGATFIICNNALTIFSGLLAQKRGLDPKAVYADLKASILPGVELVPGMVVAIEQAQRAGLTYHRQ